MTVPSRRARQTRAIYARTPDNNLRTNSPDGYLADFLPIPQPRDATDIVGQDAAWWYGQDAGHSRTTGSPLTNPERGAGQKVPHGSVLPAITRCVSILCESVVRTRWLYQDGSGNVFTRPLWVADPMLLGRAPGSIFPVQPAGLRLDGQSFWCTLLADAILWGRGAFTFQESADGTPLPGSLIPLNPFQVSVPEDGHIVLDPFGEAPLRTDYDGRFTLNGEPWRVSVLPGIYPNHAGWPQGVLLRHFDVFKLGARITGYLDSLYTAGVPSGYLSVSTPHFGELIEDPDKPGDMVREDHLLKREWMAAHGSGRRSVAILNSSVAYTPVSINPVDGEIAKLQAASRTDIAHAFGMSSVWLDEGLGGLNYSNSSERRADLVSMTAAGWGEKLTNLVSSLLPYGTNCSVSWATFIAPAIESLMPSLVQAVTSGILTATEARGYLGVTPWTGPDPAFIDNSPAAHEPAPIPEQLQPFVPVPEEGSE